MLLPTQEARPIYREINYWTLTPGLIVFTSSFFYPFKDPNNRLSSLGVGLGLIGNATYPAYQQIMSKTQTLLQRFQFPMLVAAGASLAFSLYKNITKI